MSAHYHVTMWSARISLLTFVCFLVFTNVSARTVPSCQGNSITILDTVTGKQQCEVCRDCPAGEGLSVKCGDVITPQTPVSCNPCVLGKTYSSTNEAGACKDCDNCGEYRVTKTSCTLTTNAECGKCKAGAYPEGMLAGMCVPCSPCCDDNNDIFIAGCKVPGVPADMQCSYARSEICRKVATSVMTKASVSTDSSVHITPAMVTPSTRYASATATPTNVPWYREQQPGNLANGTSPPRSAAGVSPLVAVAVIPFAFIFFIVFIALGHRYTMSRQARKNRIPDEESTENGRLPKQVQDHDDESETEDIDPSAVMLQDFVPQGVPESGDTPVPSGVQECQPPGCPNGKFPGLKPSGYYTQPRPNPSDEDHRDTKMTSEPDRVTCV